MTVIKAARTTQEIQVATFEVPVITDTMVNTAGATAGFKATAGIFDPIALPKGAEVVGGELVVETVSNDTGTATVKIGDADDDDRYLTATTLKTAARTALIITGYRHTTGKNIRITLANNTGDATTGKFHINVHYIMVDRATAVSVA